MPLVLEPLWVPPGPTEPPMPPVVLAPLLAPRPSNSLCEMRPSLSLSSSLNRLLQLTSPASSREM
jgi:hypothetical protein